MTSITKSIDISDFGLGDGDILWTPSTIIAIGNIEYHEHWDYKGRTDFYEAPYIDTVAFDASLGINSPEADRAYEAHLMRQYGCNAKFRAMIEKKLMEDVPQTVPCRKAG